MSDPVRFSQKSPLSLEIVVEGEYTTVANFILGAIEKTLEMGHMHVGERKILEQFRQDFPVKWQKLDDALALLPADIRGQAAIAAVTLMLGAQSVGAFCYGSNSTKSFLVPIIKTEALRERQQIAGIESGKARREKRRWVPHAVGLAKFIREQHPHFSQEKVAEEMADIWKLQDIDPPGHDTLKGFVAELEEDGTIPRMTR